MNSFGTSYNNKIKYFALGTSIFIFVNYNREYGRFKFWATY